MGFKMRNFLSVAAASAAIIGVAHAAPVTITFDGPAAGTIVSNQFPGVTISGTAEGPMIFDTDNPTGEDGDLGAPFTNVGPDEGSTPAGNVLIISEDGDTSDPDDNANGGTFTFDFDSVVTFLGFDAIDFSDASANLIVRLFDTSATEIFSYDFAVDGPNSVVGDNEFYSFFSSVFGTGIAGVASATIQLTGSGAIDNLSFDMPPDINDVPIPGALPLLLSGIAGLGFAMRRKKRA